MLRVNQVEKLSLGAIATLVVFSIANATDTSTHANVSTYIYAMEDTLEGTGSVKRVSLNCSRYIASILARLNERHADAMQALYPMTISDNLECRLSTLPQILVLERVLSKKLSCNKTIRNYNILKTLTIMKEHS